MENKFSIKKLKTDVVLNNKMISKNEIGTDVLWIVDKVILLKNPKLKEFFSKQLYVYKVNAGENLKDIIHFPNHVEKILKLIRGLSHHHLTLVAVGGGSVGDFSGFIASTLKRGVKFIQIPTTWLAAIDSSHGGKNALNVGPFKNQIGTFYHPKKIFIIKDILTSQPYERFTEALGEIYKMALIDNKPWGKECICNPNLTPQNIDVYLIQAINAKYKVVLKDPLEKLGIRFLLNFGHTLAHALELEFNIPHGLAVSHGLKFALWLSHEKSYLKTKDYIFIKSTPFFIFLNNLTQYKISQKKFENYLSQDKKKDKNNKIQFVFLKKMGKATAAPISIKELSQYLMKFQK